MESIHRQTAIWTQLLLFIVILLISSIEQVHCGCRMQDRNPCETICQWNATRSANDCTLRVIVILPKMDTVEASLPRVINDIFISFIAELCDIPRTQPITKHIFTLKLMSNMSMRATTETKIISIFMFFTSKNIDGRIFGFCIHSYNDYNSTS